MSHVNAKSRHEHDQVSPQINADTRAIKAIPIYFVSVSAFVNVSVSVFGYMPGHSALQRQQIITITITASDIFIECLFDELFATTGFGFSCAVL